MNLECILSKETKLNEKEIKEIIESSKNILKNKEDFKFRIELKKNKILVEINSKERTLTDFFVQFRKKLKEYLSKNYKIRVREIKINNYQISLKITKEPIEKLDIPFVNKIEIKKNKIYLTYKNLDEKFILNNNVERTIALIKEKIDKQHYEGKKEYWELMYTSPKRNITYNKDPSEEMLKKGWILRASTKGKWIYMPQFTSILRAMEKIVFDFIIKPLEFKEIIGSNIIDGEKIWAKSGHLLGMPMEIYYVAEPKSRDPKVWEKFIDKLKITKKIDYQEFKNLVSLEPLKGLTYAQCPPIYYAFKGKTIKESSLPLKIFDRTQNSFRYESGGKHGIERVDEFHRIEIIYIGKEEQLIKLREKLIKIYKKIFNQILKLEWRMAWVTPFYIQQSGAYGIEDKDKKIKGTIDFEAWLPYRGNRENSEWLEFQNVSIVGDKYTKAFNIKTQKGELWSGCSGIGLERWCTAFLAQYGLNPTAWPIGFKKYLKEVEKGFEFC